MANRLNKEIINFCHTALGSVSIDSCLGGKNIYTPQHSYRALTKRAERLVDLNPKITWTENIMMGVTIESDKYLYRVDLLQQIGAKFRMLSIEPLLSSVANIVLTDIDWVLLGGGNFLFERFSLGAELQFRYTYRAEETYYEDSPEDNTSQSFKTYTIFISGKPVRGE